MIEKKDYLTIAWYYFQQHAQQRIGYFNFFLLFSSFLTAAFVAVLKEYRTLLAVMGIAIGLMQTVISFIFWKIDERNKILTKKAENAIKELERECKALDMSFPTIFCTEEKETELQKKLDIKNRRGIFSKHISHSKSFKMIFQVFGVLGTVEIIICVVQLCVM